jgi:hypothetical protein
MTNQTQQDHKTLLTDGEIEGIYLIVSEYACRANRVALTNDLMKLLYDSKKNWITKMKQKTNRLFKNAS